MARSRLLKPGFYKNEELAQCSPHARLCFAGLWLLADRAGRLEDRPIRIKAELFPYENIDLNITLNELAERGFITRYVVESARYISVTKFSQHQTPHMREAASTIPAPVLNSASTVQAQVEASPRSSVSVSVSDPVPISIPKTETVKPNGKNGASLSPAAQTQLQNPNKDPFLDEGITQRAANFVERYQSLYPKHRSGARYACKPARDYAAAVTLCQTWPDDARLDKLAICFLTTDHKFAEEGSRTIPQFLALASWCDGKLAEWEKSNNGARH